MTAVNSAIHVISAAQIREACALLGWTPSALAERALVSLDEVMMTLDDVGIRGLGGLQVGALREVLDGAGVIFIDQDGGAPACGCSTYFRICSSAHGPQVSLPPHAPPGTPS